MMAKAYEYFAWMVMLLMPMLLEAAQPRAARIADAPTEAISCYQGRYPHLTFGPHDAQSSILVSPDGHYRAYVLVEAIVDPPNDPEHSICHNNTRLLLAKADQQQPYFYKAIFPSPTPEKTHAWVLIQDEKRDWLEGMRLVDWSMDGSLLLTETISWTYDADPGSYYNSLIYEVSKGIFQYPPVYSALEKFFSSKCEFQVRTEGFDDDNNLTLKVLPAVPDPNEGEAQVSCVKASKLFLFDVRKNSIGELPPTYKMKHYGTSVANESK